MQTKKFLKPFDYIMIGAGLTGLLATWGLRRKKPKARVLLLEKSRGLGGRLATRRIQKGEETLFFDLGAQALNVPSELEASFNLSAWKKTNGWTYPRGLSLGLAELFPVQKMTHEEHFQQIDSLNLPPCLTSQRLSKVHWNAHLGLFECHLDQKGGIEGVLLTQNIVFTAPLPQVLEILQESLVPKLSLNQSPLSSIDYWSSQIALIWETNSAYGYLGKVQGALYDQRQKGIKNSVASWVLQSETSFPTDPISLWKVHPLQMLEVSFHHWKYSQPRNTLEAMSFWSHPDLPLFILGDAFGTRESPGTLRAIYSAMNWIESLGALSVIQS